MNEYDDTESQVSDEEIAAIDEQRRKDSQEVTQTCATLLEHWQPVFDRFNENMSIVYGDQIDSEDRETLNNDDRPVVNRNVILPKVLQYLGSTLRRKRSIAAFPVDNSGDDLIAGKISKLFKHTEQDNDLDAVSLDVRAIATITKVGWYYIPPPPIDGGAEDALVKVYCEPPENVLLDADARDLDQKSWKRVGHRVWLSKDDIIALYPDCENEIEERIAAGTTPWDNLSERIKQGVRSDNAADDKRYGSGITLKTGDIADRVNNLFMIFELWERKYRHVPREDGGGMRREPYMLLRVSLPYLDICLGRYELPLQYYPFVLYQQLNFGSSVIDTRSYVDQLRPIQEEKNRLSSIAEDAASRAVAETLILGKGEDMLKGDIKLRGNRPGVYVAATDNPVADKVNSSGITTGIKELQMMNDLDFEKVSILPPAVGGSAENTNESGSYFSQKVDQGEQSVEIFSFIEWRKTLKQLYRLFLERYQAYYTEEMTLRILGEEPGKYDDVEINRFDASTGQILDDITIGRYDVTIDDVDYSNSTRNQDLVELVELMKISPPQIQALLIPEIIKNMRMQGRMQIAAMASQILAPFLMPPVPGVDGSGAETPAQNAA